MENKNNKDNNLSKLFFPSSADAEAPFILQERGKYAS